ncbi:MAG: hypothetical protein D6814_01510 [Calditrichaeota bacterium]|nr:MAG: hypothetical protein D6814_01510 [Calditrichota bacterium]
MHFLKLQKVPFRTGLVMIALLWGGLVPARAQHRGDNLAFQGMEAYNRSGVQAVARGGAMTAVSGQLEALYWNPAGLVGLQGLQFFINSGQYDTEWWERQDYRPNRQLVTMSFILDGLYRPNPEYNGWLDNEAFFADSNYVVKEPVLGKDGYDKNAADWRKGLSGTGALNIAAGLPFSLLSKSWAVAIGYNHNIPVTDYDRNQTNLVPHPAFTGYGDLPDRVTSAEDSVRIYWSDYQRQRQGTLDEWQGAIAFALNRNLQFGIRLRHNSGSTDESQTLNRIGYFDLVQGIQIFRFSYDTLDVNISGTSKFSSTRFAIGGIAQFENFSLGVNVVLPHTLSREWHLTTSEEGPQRSTKHPDTGVDEMRVPLSFSAGLKLQPVASFSLSFDIEHQPYSKAEFHFARTDSTHRPWVDQTTYRLGLEFKPWNVLSLLAGYRSVPQVFVPDGAENGRRAPRADVFAYGLSLNLWRLRFDMAYEVTRLRYYDVYFSNTNWAANQDSHLMFGVTFNY